MSCVFCDIVSGKMAAEIVWRSDSAIAFLDHKPLFPGHVLLIPTSHLQTLADLPAAEVPSFFKAAQRLERAVETAMAAEGSFVAINNRVSQSVPHLHLHVVPRRKGDGLRGFFWPRNFYTNDGHLQETGARIRSALSA